MIERAKKSGRDDSPLDVALGLLNAVSQAEIRRDRCGGTQGEEDMSPDNKLQDMIQQAVKEAREEQCKGRKGVWTKKSAD